MTKQKREITKKLFHMGALFLAAFLSLLPSCSAYATNVSIRADGTTMVNRKPFFPFGFYYVSFYSRDDAKRLDAVRKIAEAGFNVMHVPLDLNDGPLLDEAARNRVYILGEFNADPLSVVNRYENKPAILGWNIADDCDNGKKTPDEILQFHKRVKAADPQHTTYLSGGYPDRIGQCMNSANLVGMQSYPVNFEPLSSTDYSISRAVEAAPSNRPIIANLQTFAWEGSRAPTPGEVRNMTYQALVNGVKGVIYYTYRDSTWDLSSNPELWNGIKSLVPEIKKLNPILLNGDLTKISTGVEDIFAGIWTYQERKVIVALNTSGSRTKQVSIALPRGTNEAQAMFSNRPSGMVVRDGRLSGSIKPKDVHVYILRR